MKPKKYTRFTNQSLLFISGFLMLCLFSTNIHAQIQVVSGGVGLAASYPTFSSATGLFNALNATPQTGQVIVISVTANESAEDGAVALNEGAWNSIRIKPVGVRTISGNVGSKPLIDFNGADSVTFDGLNSGGNSLSISNPNTSITTNTSTIRFINGATNNVITNCTVLGSSSTDKFAYGGTIFFSTDVLTVNGNDNNVISNNNIGPAGSNLPSKAIFGYGTTSTAALCNSGIIITNNNVFDYFSTNSISSGIATFNGCSTWTITNNRLYQTGTRNWNLQGLNHRAIDIGAESLIFGAQGFTITGNIIGFATNTQTGTYTLTGNAPFGKFGGIVYSGFSGGASTTISNNTIAGISMIDASASGNGQIAPFVGILFLSGVGVANGNTIGSQSATGSLVYSSSNTFSSDVYGIFNHFGSSFTSNSNTIGGISVTYGGASGNALVVGMRSSLGEWTASSNVIGGSVANSIQLNSTVANSQVIGMYSVSGPNTIVANTIRNLTSNNGTGTSVNGITLTAMAVDTLTSNSIFNLSNTNATVASTVSGIQFQGASGSLIERNFIWGLTTATTNVSAEISGIRIAGGTAAFRNNIIAVGAGVSNAVQINGINEPSGSTNNFFHNSIYIGGSPNAGTGNSFAFNSLVTLNTRSYRDNIFVNARSNTGTASGKNYIVQVGGTTPNPAGLTIDNNVYYKNGTGTVFGRFNSTDVSELSPGWKVAVGQDASSFENDPKFNDPTNAVPDLHIHPANAGAAESHGVDVGVTHDFDGQVRSGLTPVDVGADAGNFAFVDLTGPAITYTPLTNTASTANRTTTSFATIFDSSGIKTSGGLAPRIYYKKLSDTSNTFHDNTSATAGWKFSASATGSSPFNFTINYSRLFGGSASAGDVIQYFVVAQDSAPTPNVSINSGNFASEPSSVTLTAAAFPITGTIRSYNIGVTLNLKVFLESLYDPTIGKMSPALYNQGFTSDSTAADSITVELHNATTLNLTSSCTAILHANGTGKFTFLVQVGNSFYIAYKHRNGLETWTKNPVLISAQGMTYDLTTP